MPRRILSAFLAGVVLSACGEETPKPKAEPQSQQPVRHVSSFRPQTVPDLGRLVPADAVGLVVFAPSGQLDAKRRRFMEEVRPGDDTGGSWLALLLAAAGADEGDVDPARPVAVALTLDEDDAPQLTFILPARGGDYVAKGYAAPVAAAAPPLARDLPGGDIAFRFDLERLLPAFRPLIDPFLSPDVLAALDPSVGEEPDAVAMLDLVTSGARSLLDSAAKLKGAMSLNGGKVELSLVLEVREGSPLDSKPVTGGASFAELAKRIDARQCAMTVLIRSDWTGLNEAMRPFYAATFAQAPGGKADLDLWIKLWDEAYAAMGPSLAMGIDLDAAGLRFVGAMRPEDPAAYLKRYGRALAQGPRPNLGMEFVGLGPVETGGVAMEAYRVEIDWAQLISSRGARAPRIEGERVRELVHAIYGKDGIRFAQGAVGEYAIMTTPAVNGSYATAVKTAKEGSGAIPPDAAGAITDDTTFLVHMELRRFLTGIAEIVAKVDPDGQQLHVPAGPPVHVWFRAGQKGRTYSFACDADVAGTMRLFRSLR